MGLFSKPVEEKMRDSFIQVCRNNGISTSLNQVNNMIVEIDLGLLNRELKDSGFINPLLVNFRLVEDSQLLLKMICPLRGTYLLDDINEQSRISGSAYNDLLSEMRDISFDLEFNYSNEPPYVYPSMVMYAQYGTWNAEDIFEQVSRFTRNITIIDDRLYEAFEPNAPQSPANV